MQACGTQQQQKKQMMKRDASLGQKGLHQPRCLGFTG